MNLIVRSHKCQSPVSSHPFVLSWIVWCLMDGARNKEMWVSRTCPWCSSMRFHLPTSWVHSYYSDGPYCPDLGSHTGLALLEHSLGSSYVFLQPDHQVIQ